MGASTTIEDLDSRYPIGKFTRPETISAEDRKVAIQAIAEMPAKLAEALQGLTDAQLDTPYREGGWTVRQLVHHIADSHLNALSRIKLALTEDWPTIYAYDEKAWAELADAKAPAAWSLSLLEGLHARWATLLQSLGEEQWKRGFKHPERGPMTIETATLMYAWHSRHHVAHITKLRESRGW